MKKFFYVAVLALAFASCGKTQKAEEAKQNVVISEDGQKVTELGVATDVLPENLEMGTQYEISEDGQKVTEYNNPTEVLPATAPGNGEVAPSK